MKLYALVTLSILFCTASGLAADAIGDVMNVTGKTTITREQTKLSVAPGDQLQTGDLVTTGSDGAIGISFTDGSRISLGAESELRMDSFVFEPQSRQYGMAMFLKKGVAAIATGKMAKLAPDAMSVSTPLATLGIRGTKFLVKAQ